MPTPPNDGGPAFPRPASSTSNGYMDSVLPDQSGMSLLDWYAGQALQGLLADNELRGETASFAEAAFDYAEAMIAERARRALKAADDIPFPPNP